MLQRFVTVVTLREKVSAVVTKLPAWTASRHCIREVAAPCNEARCEVVTPGTTDVGLLSVILPFHIWSPSVILCASKRNPVRHTSSRLVIVWT